MRRATHSKYLRFIEELHSRARRSRWKIFYDEEADSLYWTKEPFPSRDKLAKVAKEIFFFLNRKGTVNGLMIQPFRSNFVAHNEEVLGAAKMFTRKEEGGILTIPDERKSVADSLLVALTATIKKDIYQDIAESDYSLADLESFLTSSVKVRSVR